MEKSVEHRAQSIDGEAARDGGVLPPATISVVVVVVVRLCDGKGSWILLNRVLHMIRVLITVKSSCIIHHNILKPIRTVPMRQADAFQPVELPICQLLPPMRERPYTLRWYCVLST